MPTQNQTHDGVIRSEAKGSTLRVKLIGTIGWEVWGPRLGELLDAIDPEETNHVKFEIYSYGGDVWDGNYIIQKIAALPMATTAVVYIAASMATQIALACQRVVMASNGRWLIHNPWTMLSGDAATLEKTAVELRETEIEAAELYARKTGASVEDMLALMAEERWMRAPEALDVGFVDEISDPFDRADYAAIDAAARQAASVPTHIAALLDDLDAEDEDDTQAGDTDAPPADPPEDTGGTDDVPETDPGSEDAPAEAGDEAAPDTPDDDAADDAGEEAATVSGHSTEDIGNHTDPSDAVTALTLRVADLQAEVNTLTETLASERAQHADELQTRDARIATLRGQRDSLTERLRKLLPGMAGTDEDEVDTEPTADGYWSHVRELIAAGCDPEKAHLTVQREHPDLHRAMLRAAKPHKD